MKTLKTFFLFAIIFLSYSCSDALYEEHKDVKEVLVWDRSDVKEYQATIPDGAAYTVELALRHHSQIANSSIPIEITITNPEGVSETKNVDFPIRDQNGDLVGSAAGDLCDTEMTVMPNHTFSPTGAYTFKVAHKAEDDKIAGMMEVGLRITPVVKK